MTDRGRELLAYCQNHKEEFLNLLQSLVEQETPSNDPESFNRLLSILQAQFEKRGFSVSHHKGAHSAGQLLCQPQKHSSEKAYQFIVGHIDTVWSKGTLQDMPFKIEGDTAAGPGIFDMKAGIAMMLFALRAIGELGKNLELAPVFLITTDEEIGSSDSKELIIEQAQNAERTFVLEPSLDSDGKIKTRRKGVGEFEIHISGKPSHAGLAPEEGVSAILGLSHIVQQLFRLNDPSEGISVNVGTIEGGERSNVIAAKSKAKVDIRFPTQEDGEKLKHAIYNLQPEIDGIDLEITGGIDRPPLEKGLANEKLWTLTRRLGKELGLELREGISGGASDGNFTNLYSPTIDGLGAVGEGAHAYHEKIFISKTLERLALFTLLLLQPSLKNTTTKGIPSSQQGQHH